MAAGVLTALCIGLLFPGLVTLLNHIVLPLTPAAWAYLSIPFAMMIVVYVWIGVYTSRLIADIRAGKSERITDAPFSIFLVYLDGIVAIVITLSSVMLALDQGIKATGGTPPFGGIPPGTHGYDLAVTYTLGDTMGWFFTSGADNVTVDTWIGSMFKIITLATGVTNLAILVGLGGIAMASHISKRASQTRAITARIRTAYDQPRGYQNPKEKRHTAYTNTLSGRTAQ